MKHYWLGDLWFFVHERCQEVISGADLRFRMGTGAASVLE